MQNQDSTKRKRPPNKPFFTFTQADIDRFWSHVKIGAPGECWPTDLRGKTPIQNTYGQFGVNGITFLTHRVAYFLANGDDPGELLVCHSCDWKRCCNPSHLKKATKEVNNREATERGLRPSGDRSFARRFPEKLRRGDAHHARRLPSCLRRGSSHPLAKYSENIIQAVRYDKKLGMSYGALVKKYQIPKSTIVRIVKRRIWAHLKDPDAPNNITPLSEQP